MQEHLSNCPLCEKLGPPTHRYLSVTMEDGSRQTIRMSEKLYQLIQEAAKSMIEE